MFTKSAVCLQKSAVCLRSNSSRFVQTRPKLSKLVQIRLDSSKLVQTRPNSSKLVQICLNSSKLVQTRSNSFKIVQTRPNLSKLFSGTKVAVLLHKTADFASVLCSKIALSKGAQKQPFYYIKRPILRPFYVVK